jgi:hypothetical protein
MEWFQIIFLGIACAVVGPLLFRMFKYKSFSAAMLGAPIRSTVGEIELNRSSFSSSVLKVHALGSATGADRSVGLQLVSKAALGASAMPIKLSVQQAQELSVLLLSATKA